MEQVFFTLLISFIFLVILVTIIWFINYKKHKAHNNLFSKIILHITLPRESTDKEDDKRENLQHIKEDIGIMEAIYANISGLSGVKSFSRDNTLSFEIVSQNGSISFYISVPNKLEQFVTQQIHAQYPDAHIERRDDYNIFSPHSIIDGVYLKFAKNSLLPIQTYKNLQSDPLSATINALSKMEGGDGAAIQFIAKPVSSGWRSYGAKVSNEIRKGKSINEALNTQGSASSSIFGGIMGDIMNSFWGSTPKSKENEKEKEKEIPKTISPMVEDAVKRIEEKISKSVLAVNVRIVVASENKEKVSIYLDNILNSFAQYNIYEYGNSFVTARPFKKVNIINDFIYRNYVDSKKIIVNSEEMASLFHFPSDVTETPNVEWLSSKKAPAPTDMVEGGIILGENIYRDKRTLIKIGREDRTRHTYIIGKSGVGKSVLMTNMARQDILNGDGLCVIDPHGELVDDILATIPKERLDDVIYFNPADVSRPMGINLLEYDPRYPEQKTFVINEMIGIFDKLYDLKATGGPMFEQYMRNAMMLIMDDPESGSTLMEISKVLVDVNFRKYKLSKCSNPVVRDFWEKEAEKAGGDAALANMVPYITSKLNTFISNDIMRPIIGQQHSSFNLRDIMDNKKILLVSLSKGRLGELNSHLLGMVIVGKILMAALSRTDMPREERSDFYLYLDEFQNFITDSIAIILSEARKYRLCLNMAHQYIGQLSQKQDTTIRDAIFGNVGTMISFKVGVEDAEFLAKEFAPIFNAHDLVNIDKFNAYVKLIVNNQPARAFNMQTIPFERSTSDYSVQAKKISSLRYGKDRSLVEAEILQRIKVVSKKV